MRNLFILFVVAFVVAAFALGDTMLRYEVLNEEDNSHGAANRINAYLRLQSDCTKQQVLEIVNDATSKYKPNYDIVWLTVVPKDATKAPEGWTGWRPILCRTKWISPSLDEKWHTTGNGFDAGRDYESIAVNWAEWFEKDQPAPITKEVPVSPSQKQTFMEKTEVLVPALVDVAKQVIDNYERYGRRQISNKEFNTFMEKMKPVQDSIYDGSLNLGRAPSGYYDYKTKVVQLKGVVNDLFLCYDDERYSVHPSCTEKRRNSLLEYSIDLYQETITKLRLEAAKVGLETNY